MKTAYLKDDAFLADVRAAPAADGVLRQRCRAQIPVDLADVLEPMVVEPVSAGIDPSYFHVAPRSFLRGCEPRREPEKAG